MPKEDAEGEEVSAAPPLSYDFHTARYFLDLTGRRFGTRVVLWASKAGKTPRKRYWATICDCGRSATVRGSSLLAGRAGCRSCSQVIHGHAPTRSSMNKVYRAWIEMIRRCTDPKRPMYKYYGGRGISVNPAWMGKGGYQIFMGHIGTPANWNDSLDRIDPNGDYTYGNVRWASKQLQAENRRPRDEHAAA